MNRRLLRFICLVSFLSFLLNGCAFVWRFPAFQVSKSKNPKVYRGIFHVHSEFSHDSKATLERMIHTAERAGLDFVVVTDHNNLDARAAYQKMNAPARPLLIFGDEVSTSAGHLIGLGIQEAPDKDMAPSGIHREIHRQGGYSVIAHPLSPKKPWADWSLQDVEGMEIYSFPDVYYTQDLTTLIPKAVFLPPALFLKNTLLTPANYLNLWDEQLSKRKKLAAFSSVDAHLRYEWLGFAPENYLLYFQAVTMYVLSESFNEPEIIGALANGKSYIAFEARGGASNFRFSAAAEHKVFEIGGHIPEGSEPITFNVETVLPGDIRLIHNGQLIAGTNGTQLEKKAFGTGYYRVEVYRGGQIWIISNPIYVE